MMHTETREEILNTVRELYRVLEREVEWKLTDSVSTAKAHVIVDPVTRALDNVIDQVESLE